MGNLIASAMTRDVQAEQAFILETEIKQLRRQTNTAFWQMIDRLAKAKEIKVWEQLGHDSWSSWLAQEGLDLRANTVDRYLRAYRAIESRVDEAVALPLFSISRSKVLMIANKLTPENSEELIEKARQLSYSDLQREVSSVEEYEDNPRPPKPDFAWDEQRECWTLTKGSLSNICI